MSLPCDSLAEVTSWYRNEAEVNDQVHLLFTDQTNKHESLAAHRGYIERNKLGFGDRAFHYMWWLIVKDVASRSEGDLKFLEIGVYKGQVISLWLLLAGLLNRKVEVYGVSPMTGNFTEPKSWTDKFTLGIRRLFRGDLVGGNMNVKEDYHTLVNDLLNRFQLDRRALVIHEGYSTDRHILGRIEDHSMDVIYIDGDHRFEVCRQDIINYDPKLKRGGLMVLDDAGYFLPGGGEGKWWKGYEDVARAAEMMPELGYENILNVGHNRVYKKL